MKGVYFYRGKWRVHFRASYRASFDNELSANAYRASLEKEYGKLNPYKVDYSGREFGNLTVVGDSPNSKPKKRVLVVHDHRIDDYYELPLTTLLGGNNRGVGKSKSGKSKSNKTSGINGVSLYKRTGKWQAYIRPPYSEKRLNLGTFETKDEAIAARKAAERKYLGGNN